MWWSMCQDIYQLLNCAVVSHLTYSSSSGFSGSGGSLGRLGAEDNRLGVARIYEVVPWMSARWHGAIETGRLLRFNMVSWTGKGSGYTCYHMRVCVAGGTYLVLRSRQCKEFAIGIQPGSKSNLTITTRKLDAFPRCRRCPQTRETPSRVEHPPHARYCCWPQRAWLLT